MISQFRFLNYRSTYHFLFRLFRYFTGVGQNAIIGGDQDKIMSLEDTTSVCGYHLVTEENKIKPQPRIVGGTVVDNVTMFPWQLSLATGVLDYWYQHR